MSTLPARKCFHFHLVFNNGQRHQLQHTPKKMENIILELVFSVVPAPKQTHILPERIALTDGMFLVCASNLCLCLT